MTPAEYRRDRWLRSSAYHLSTWSLAAFVLAFRAETVPDPFDATGLAVALVVVGGSAMSSLTHERRVGKMAGVAGEAVYAGAGRMWAGVFGALALSALALVLRTGRADGLYLLGMVGVGTGFALWGRRARFGWYLGLGAAMVAAGVLDGVMASAGGPARLLRLLVLGLLLPAAALLTNRRWLWFRADS